MKELGIHTQLNTRYHVFDASGQLPFIVVFGLCRRSSADTDPRPLLLEVAGSALDVPYALTHGLLTLHKRGLEDNRRWIEVDLSQLNKISPQESYRLSLPSPINRTEHWRDSFTVYQCRVNVSTNFASVLEPEVDYAIRLASNDLGVNWWTYSELDEFSKDQGKPSDESEAVKLVNNKYSGGKAPFTFSKRLSWPPKIETTMRLCPSSQPFDSAAADTKLGSSVILEVSVTNTGSHPVTVQAQGHQRYLIPWGPFQPEDGGLDNRVRIVAATPSVSPTSSLQVSDFATGKVVVGTAMVGTGPLIDTIADLRPRAEDLVILKPGEPLIKEIDIRPRVARLEDGRYKIRMHAIGCRWWDGEVELEGGESKRVPADLCAVSKPPLMLESQDEVVIRIGNGKIESDR